MAIEWKPAVAFPRIGHGIGRFTMSQGSDADVIRSSDENGVVLGG